jgi:hypothetical protein
MIAVCSCYQMGNDNTIGLIDMANINRTALQIIKTKGCKSSKTTK